MSRFETGIRVDEIEFPECECTALSVTGWYSFTHLVESNKFAQTSLMTIKDFITQVAF